MTGPGHYTEAELLLDQAEHAEETRSYQDADQEAITERVTALTAAAQAHATLALVDAVRRNDPAQIGKAIDRAVAKGARKQVRS